MVAELSENQPLDFIENEPGVGEYRQMAEILIRAIPNDRKSMWAGRVMTYLANEALRAASQNQLPARVPTKAIHADLGGNRNQEPSGWLSQIWKDIEKRYYPEIEPTLIELARRAGLNAYPTLEKDNGKPAFYRIAAKLIPVSEDSQADDDGETISDGSIVYKRDLTLKLSTLGKLIFEGGLKWTSSKRWGYVTWQLLFLFGAAVLVLMTWLVLWFRTVPLTGQDLVLFALGIGFPWGAYLHFSRIFQIFDDRIMIAPDWILSWKEFGATVEINRSEDPDGPSAIHVHRYSAQCPICGWMVKLDKGEPDFPGRIVGRCEENPREHVFSFDRSNKQGRYLRK